jgi:predicted DCC family thiol-disulfide oxidoreductase YuxK
VNAEITDKVASAPLGWVFYDGECGFCVDSQRRWGGLFARRGFVWLPLQSAEAPRRLGAHAATMRGEMKLLLANGDVAGGIAAWAVLFCSVWWLWPAGVLLGWPGVRWLGGLGYAWLARNRYCLDGSRRLPAQDPKHARHSAFFEMP